MKRWGSLITIVSCVAIAACDDGGGSAGDDGGDDGIDADAGATPGEPEGLIGITDAHNIVRGNTMASPALPDLAWDDGLAATAAAWIAMCRDTDAPAGLINHNPNRGNNVGENVFGASAGASGIAALDAWASEISNYDYAHNMCNMGNMVCGHYTQVVWRTTTKVGCAIGTCPGLTFGSVVVCNYSPAGNSGGRPF